MAAATRASLFQPAAKTARFFKVLLYGAWSSGKTRAALGFPGPIAVIDLEASTALYDGFDVVRTRDLPTIERAIAEIAASGKYKTLIIDPITVIYQLMQFGAEDIVAGRNKGQSSLESGQTVGRLEWGIIKRAWANVMTQCTNLPCNVVLIARQSDVLAPDPNGRKGETIKVGVKADADKSTMYIPDLVLQMNVETRDGKASYWSVVEKSRIDGLAVGQRLSGYMAGPLHGLYEAHLAPFATALAQGAPTSALETEGQAVAGYAQVMAGQNAPPDTAKGTATAEQVAEMDRLSVGAGMTLAELCKSLAVANLAELSKEKAARAINRLREKQPKQITTTPAQSSAPAQPATPAAPAQPTAPAATDPDRAARLLEIKQQTERLYPGDREHQGELFRIYSGGHTSENTATEDLPGILAKLKLIRHRDAARGLITRSRKVAEIRAHLNSLTLEPQTYQDVIELLLDGHTLDAEARSIQELNHAWETVFKLKSAADAIRFVGSTGPDWLESVPTTPPATT